MNAVLALLGRNEATLAGAVVVQPVVAALEAAIDDVAVRQSGAPVRAAVREHMRFAVAASPNDEVLAQSRDPDGLVHRQGLYRVTLANPGPY